MAHEFGDPTHVDATSTVPERTYKIGEFAAMTGMTPSKVRFYDKAGLFTSSARRERLPRVHPARRLQGERVPGAFVIRVHHRYVICMSVQEAWRLDRSDHPQVSRLPLGKCLRYRR